MADREHTYGEKMETERKNQRTPDTGVEAREMYVEELLDRKIEEMEHKVRALRQLKGGMSQSFLRSGASTLAALIGY